MDNVNTILEQIEKGIEGYKSEVENLKKEFATVKSLSTIGEKESLADKKVKFYNGVFKKTIGTSDSTGGYLIPEEVATDIIDSVIEADLSGVTVYPMASDILNVPSLSSLTATYVAPGSAITGQDITLTNYKLQTYPVSVLLPIDNNFLQDVNTKAITYLENMAIKAIAYRALYCALRGSGSADANNAGVSGVFTVCPTGQAFTMATSAIADFDADDIASMIDLPTGKINNGQFYFDKSFRKVIRTMKDGDDRFIFSPAGEGDVERIYGYPVNWVPSGILPAYSDVGKDTKFGIFGDSSYILMGDRGGLNIALSSEAGFTSNTSYIRLINRQAIAVNPDGFGIIKTKA